MGVVENNVCNLCLTERDTIFHCMCQCEHTQSFWVGFEKFLKEKSFNCARISINRSLILFGHDGKNKQTDEGFDMQHYLCINAV